MIKERGGWLPARLSTANRAQHYLRHGGWQNLAQEVGFAEGSAESAADRLCPRALLHRAGTGLSQSCLQCPG